jgi:tetratricopeptide (TPR) repeat protein
MRDDALKALLEERWAAALAKYGERLLKDPEDRIARSNRAVALYEAGRWPEAAKAFEEVLRREGPTSEVAPPALFSLGYCRLELDDPSGALEASALFLELSNEELPFYWDGVQNIACAADRLGNHAVAVELYRVVLGVVPHPYAYNGLALALGDLDRAAEGLYVLDACRRSGNWDEVLHASLGHLTELAQGRRKPTALTAPRWSRTRILRVAFRLLGWHREPLPRSALVCVATITCLGGVPMRPRR